jgi:hypothetical protein
VGAVALGQTDASIFPEHILNKQHKDRFAASKVGKDQLSEILCRPALLHALTVRSIKRMAREMARLPHNYQAVLRNGLEALRWAHDTLEERLARTPTDEHILLEIRDVSGLLGRLKDTDREDWEDRFMVTSLSGQDVGVLEKWEVQSASAPNASGRSRQFRALRQMIAQYLDAG